MSRKYNVVDADGHVLEPGDLWVKNVDPKFRDMVPQVVVDEAGRDRLKINGKYLGTAQVLANSGAVGVPTDQIEKRGYADGAKGGFDPHARIKALEIDNIDAVFLYPTLGLVAGAIQDAETAAAVCRVYNTWLADYCKAVPDRLFGVAMLPMQTVETALAELRYARNKLGMRSAFLRPNPYAGRLLSNPDYNVLWAEAQELDVSIAFHEGSSSGMPAVGVDRVPDYGARHIATHTMEMMLAALNIIWGGVCERFPRLRFAFLESGGGWMPPWLDRMDRHYVREGLFGTENLKMLPSEYFKRQCWISFEPVENGIAFAAEQLGPSKLLWATDYPHGDGYFPGAPASVARKVPENVRQQVMAQGAIDFYKLKA